MLKKFVIVCVLVCGLVPVLAAQTMGWWVVTWDGRKFDGPYKYVTDCTDAARAHAKRYQNISLTCAYR